MRLDAPVHFRTDAKMLAAASEKARRQGVTLSEFLRDVLRQTVRDAA